MKIIASRSAFTLVEIMITVAIIGTVTAIAIPNFITSRESAVRNACLANMKQMESALTRAALETNASISGLSEDGIKTVVWPDYISTMPHCSLGTYSTNDSGDVLCSSHSQTGGSGSGSGGSGGTTHVISEPHPGQLVGDLDGDGRITIFDVGLMRYLAAQLIQKPQNMACCDINGDGRIDSADLSMERQLVARQMPWVAWDKSK